MFLSYYLIINSNVKDLWIPDISPHEKFVSHSSTSLYEGRVSFEPEAVKEADGRGTKFTLTWDAIYAISCDVNVSKFPWDKHTCEVLYTSYEEHHDTDGTLKLRFTDKKNILPKKYEKQRRTSEFLLEEISNMTKFERESRLPDGFQFHESVVGYTLTLKRESYIHFWGIIIPAILVTYSLFLCLILFPGNGIFNRVEWMGTFAFFQVRFLSHANSVISVGKDVTAMDIILVTSLAILFLLILENAVVLLLLRHQCIEFARKIDSLCIHFFISTYSIILLITCVVAAYM